MGKEAARLQAEIEALLTKAGMVDAEEDERWGEDFRGDELPEELQRREKRLAAIQAAPSQSRAGQMSTLGPKSHLSGGHAPIAQHQNFYGVRS